MRKIILTAIIILASGSSFADQTFQKLQEEYFESFIKLHQILSKEQQDTLQQAENYSGVAAAYKCSLLATINKQINNQLGDENIGLACLYQQKRDQIKFLDNLYEKITHFQ